MSLTLDRSGRLDTELTADEAERLARLWRGSSGSELAPSTRALLQSLLHAEIGAGPVLTPEAQGLPQLPTRHEPASEAAAAVPMQAGAAASSWPEPVPETAAVLAELPPLESLPQLSLQLRQLADAEAPWEVLEPLACKIYAMEPSLEAAARLIELAFLHANVGTLEALLGWANTAGSAFYYHLHPTMRAHLVIRLWQAGGSETLCRILLRERDSDHLLPAERLFLFEILATAHDVTTPLIYFRRYRSELFSAVSAIGGWVQLSQARFLLRVGKLALEAQAEDEAAQLLQKISESEPEYDEALRLLLALTGRKHKAEERGELPLAAASDQERLAHLQHFLSETRARGAFPDRSGAALNELLADPLTWLTADPELWTKLSTTLIASRDLAALLPNLLNVFHANILKFHAPALDMALWHGPASMTPLTARDQYWHGVALLHLYVGRTIAHEEDLWRAFNAVTSAKKNAQQALPVAWADLQKAAFTRVAKAPHLLEAERNRMLKQLRVALPAAQVTSADLEAYAAQEGQAPAVVLQALQEASEGIKETALARRFLLKRAQQTHLTNADLNHLWQLALQLPEHDLAWRVATVVHARQGLSPAVRHAWEFSGEKRAQYAFYVPARAHMDFCLVGSSSAAARLAHACLTVGAALPELLAMLDPGSAVTRVVAAPKDSIEARVDQALAELDWLPKAKRRYRFSTEAALGGAQLPAFMQILPANPWAMLVARLSERLGINAWGWRLSRLQTQIVDLIPLLTSRQDLRRNSGRVANWLRDLTPEQRLAWKDLSSLARSMDDQTAAHALAAFVCRLATVICPNHYMALVSMQAMRAPVALIWDLEAWLLGEPYGKIRRGLGTATRVPVPHSLQRLASILA